MADANETMLLVNPGGRVVEVTKAHAEQLLESDEGFKKAPKGAKANDRVGDNPDEIVPAENNLVPRGSSEEEAKKVAALQGTPENAKAQAAADPTNDTVAAPEDTDGQDKNETDPGAGAVGDDNTDNGDHPNTSGQGNSTSADEAVANGDASTGDANEKGKGAGRFFGRGKKK